VEHKRLAAVRVEKGTRAFGLKRGLAEFDRHADGIAATERALLVRLVATSQEPVMIRTPCIAIAAGAEVLAITILGRLLESVLRNSSSPGAVPM
jgi:hypothetical protein